MPRPGHNPSDSSEHHPDIPEPPEPAQKLHWKLYRTFIWADTWGEMMGRCSSQNDDGKKFHDFSMFLYPVSSRNVEVENNPLQKWIEMRNFTSPDYRRPEFFLWIIATRWTDPEGLPVGCRSRMQSYPRSAVQDLKICSEQKEGASVGSNRLISSQKQKHERPRMIRLIR